MKRSTKVFLGAMGLVTVAWGVERAMQPKLPPCPVGPDGKPIVTPQCQDMTSSSRSSSSSSSSRSYYGGSSSSGSSWGHGTSSSVGHAVSSGGWGGMGRAFSGGS